MQFMHSRVSWWKYNIISYSMLAIIILYELETEIRWSIFWHNIFRFTNEKSLEQHKEEHKASILREKDNKKISPVIVNKDSVSNKKEENGKPDSGEVKATCPQCNQTFRRKFNMTIHIDRVIKFFPFVWT